MSRNSYLLLMLAIIHAPASLAQAAALPAADPGEILFARYGCANCHGADGINTLSKYVPVLRGKPARFIVQRSEAILRGKDGSVSAQLMHQQFCPGDASVNCTSAPSIEELHIIANWLDDAGDIPIPKITPQALYLTSLEAYALVSRDPEKTLFVDIRTPAEVAYVGIAQGIDYSIPYMHIRDWNAIDDKRKALKLDANINFVAHIEQGLQKKGLGKTDRIILICRSGDRSAKAAGVLFLAGYSNVYTVTDGFEGDLAKAGARKGERALNGWRNSDLPWSYELVREKLRWN